MHEQFRAYHLYRLQRCHWRRCVSTYYIVMYVLLSLQMRRMNIHVSYMCWTIICTLQFAERCAFNVLPCCWRRCVSTLVNVESVELRADFPATVSICMLWLNVTAMGPKVLPFDEWWVTDGASSTSGRASLLSLAAARRGTLSLGKTGVCWLQ
jgi:hypothetical protein